MMLRRDRIAFNKQWLTFLSYTRFQLSGVLELGGEAERG